MELGEASETGKTQCCPIRCHNNPLVVQVQIIISQVVPIMIPIFRLKTGVQIVGGVLAILSGVLLVLFFAKLDEVGTSFLFEWKQYKIIRIEYFFKAEMHTHRTKTNKKTTQREL